MTLVCRLLGSASFAAAVVAALGFCAARGFGGEPAGSSGDAGVMVDPNKVPVESPSAVNAPAPKVLSGRPAPRPSPFRLGPPAPGEPTVSQPPATQPALTGPPPVVKVDELTYDFGKVLGTEAIEHTFKLKNVGEGQLTIEAVQPQCGCTTAGTWAKTVAPGGTWELPITLRIAGAEGRQTKYITVRTNDPKLREVRYTITGECRSRFGFKPGKFVRFDRCQRETVTKRTITISNQTEAPIVLKEPVSESKSFQAELRELEAGKEYELEVTTVPPLSEGYTQGKVAIQTDCKEEPMLSIMLYAQVPPRLTLAPLVVAVPSPTAQDTKRSLTLRNEGSTPVHVKQVVASDPSVQSEVVPTEEGKLYQIWLTVPKDQTIPPTGYTVTVETDDAKMPKFTAVIRGYPARPPTTAPARAIRPPTTQPIAAPHAFRGPGVK